MGRWFYFLNKVQFTCAFGCFNQQYLGVWAQSSVPACFPLLPHAADVKRWAHSGAAHLFLVY